jgi:hypothetical protein
MPLATPTLALRSQEREFPSRAEPVRHALLVGIEAYPERAGWPRLSGPRADAEALREALVARGGFAPERIRMLLDAEATRAAILTAFDGMIGVAGPEDVLLFYFAGHGSRLPDRDGDEPDGWDETIVPYDAVGADERANDLLDEELGAMIERANEATRHVVLIFDCCSSGTNVRSAGDATRRFVAFEARGLAGARDLAPAAREPGSGYFKKNLDYVALAACRASENAYEVKLESAGGATESRGLFTLAIVQELYEPAGETSYEELMDRVRRRVQAQQATQTPVIEGTLARNRLFEREGEPWVPSFPIARHADGVYVLEAGLVHNLQPRTVLSVYDWSVRRDVGAGRLGKVRIEEVGPTESSFVWIDGGPPPESTRLRAFELERGPEDLRLGFVIEAPEEQREIAEALAQRLERGAHLRRVPLAGAGLVLACIDTRKGLRWSVSTRGGTALPLGANCDSEEQLALLAAALERLGKAHRVRYGVQSSQSGLLDVETSLAVVDVERGQLGQPERDDAGVPILRPGTQVRCRLVNRSPVPVFATLLVISPDGSIFVDACTETPDDAVPPDRAVESSLLNMILPEGNEAFYSEGSECFRWVVTTTHHDLRALAQDAVTVHETLRGGAAQMNPVFSGKAPQPVHSWLTRTTEVRLLTAEEE